MKKYNMFGILLLGFLLISTGFGLVAAADDFGVDGIDDDGDINDNENEEDDDGIDDDDENDDDDDENDDDDDGIDDDFEDENKRDIKTDIDDDEFEIESKIRYGGTIDELRLKVRHDDRLSFKFTYESESESESGSESELELEFKVEFRKLIEYVDLDDNGMYNKSVDQFIQEIKLDSFQPIIYTTSSLSDDTTLHYFIANTTDGVFTAHIFFVEEFTVINSSFIAPTQTKIDIEITNFNYIANNSQLGLYIRLESEVEYEEDDETQDETEGNATDEDGIVLENKDYTGIFTWKENAIIDGVVMDVLSNKLDVDDDDEGEQKLILNYPRGNHIYHDPKVGMTYAQPSGSSASPTSILPVVLTGTGASIIIIGVIVIVLIKKRKIA